MQLDSVPESVVSTLQSAEHPLSLPEIRDALVDYGLSQEEARKLGGASLARALDAHPDIECESVAATLEQKAGQRRGRSRRPISTVKKYRWVGGHIPREDDQIADEASDEAVLAGDERRVSDGTSLDSLVEVLISVDQPIGALDLRVVAAALEGASQKQVRDALEALEKARGIDATLLFLAAPSQSRSIRKSMLHWATNGGSDAALSGALAWITEPGSPSKQLENCASVLAEAGREWGRPVADFCLFEITRRVGSARSALLSVLANTDYYSLSQAMRESDVQQVRAALRTEVMGPGKRRVLWAMMQAEADSVDDPGVWSQVTMSDLMAMSESPRERTLLDRSWVQDHVVRPLIAKDLQSGDRFAVSRVMSYPSAIFRVVSPEQLQEVLQLASKQDVKIKEMLAELRQDATLKGLEQELDSARDGLVEAQREQAHLQDRLKDREASVLLWQEKTRLAEQEQVTSGTHEIRQAHVDGMKAFAEGLAAVDRLGPDANSAAASTRLLALAKRHGISVIGARGEVVDYDPNLHLALTDLEEGEPAVVHERGFLLHEATGNTVLARATVSRETAV